MCDNFPNIRITEGNAFALLLPLRTRTYVSSKPIDEDIDYTQLENIVFTFGGVEYAADITDNGVQIILPDTLAAGTYNAILTAEYLGNEIRAAYESAVTIVPWSAQSTAEQYIVGSPIVMRAAYVLSGAMTDAELEALKEEYRDKIAEAEQAKEDAEQAKAEWEQKAAELDGVAQEATLTQGVQNIREDIANIDIDTSDLAKEATLQDIIAANILQPNLQGLTFDEGWTTDNIVDILAYTKTRMHGELVSDIEAPIVSFAFQQCSSLTSANFPNATSIGTYAFQQCSSLTSANFPNATSIGTYAFQYCSSLTSANFPNATSIGSNAFHQCSSLTSANFPNATSIGTYAFQYCSSLTSANFPNATSIGTNAFHQCSNLIDITIGERLNNSINFNSAQWNPTNAYSTINRNLIPSDIQELHPLWYNLDYLLYCLREHFAANLPDRTGQTALTITFNATMKGHINNSPETVAAFTDKNWIIA